MIMDLISPTMDSNSMTKKAEAVEMAVTAILLKKFAI